MFIILQLSGMPMTDEDSLDDLSDIVGPELAGLVNAPVTMQPVKTSVTSQASFTSDMPPDISDLRSSDLLQTLSGVIDIDKVFADIQAEQHHQQQQHDVSFKFLYFTWHFRIGRCLLDSVTVCHMGEREDG